MPSVMHDQARQIQRVEIHRNAEGDLVPHPIAVDQGAALLEALDAFDPDFGQVLQDLQHEQLPMQGRASL
jgi:antitoxin VapB